MGLYDRQTRTVRAHVVPNLKRETLKKAIMEAVRFGSSIYTDQAVAYDSLKGEFIHETVITSIIMFAVTSIQTASKTSGP
jgi:transposase-like protein